MIQFFFCEDKETWYFEYKDCSQIDGWVWVQLKQGQSQGFLNLVPSIDFKKPLPNSVSFFSLFFFFVPYK